MNVNEFFAMGGYGFYVWGAYGITALIIVAEVLAVRARGRAALEQSLISAAAEGAQ